MINFVGDGKSRSRNVCTWEDFFLLVVNYARLLTAASCLAPLCVIFGRRLASFTGHVCQLLCFELCAFTKSVLSIIIHVKSL